MKRIGKYTLRQIYWLFEAGWPKRKMSEMDLLFDKLESIPYPTFFLSTGRTGTQWFAELFARDRRNLISFHEPLPSFIIQNRFYYDLLHSDADEQMKFETGKQIFLTGRVEYFIYSYKADKHFVETNHYLTFFARVIAKILPQSKFVHLYRHPGDFIRSALNKGWYATPRIDNTLIVPKVENWDSLDRIEKNAYLWVEVNKFAEELKAGLGPERVFDFNFSDMSPEKVHELVEFVGGDISLSRIKRFKGRKINKSRQYKFPPYSQWAEADKQKVRKICGPLAQKYGYEL